MSTTENGIERMGLNELFIRYKGALDFTTMHGHDTFLENDKIHAIAILTFFISLISLIISAIYYWVTGIAFHPELSILFVGIVAILIFLAYVAIYRQDQEDLICAQEFMADASSVYPGIHNFVVAHADDEFIPPHSMFPLKVEDVKIDFSEIEQETARKPDEVMVVLGDKKYTRKQLTAIIKEFRLDNMKPEDFQKEPATLGFLVS